MDTRLGLDDGTCMSTNLPYLGMKKLTFPVPQPPTAPLSVSP